LEAAVCWRILVPLYLVTLLWKTGCGLGSYFSGGVMQKQACTELFSTAIERCDVVVGMQTKREKLD
jgi:hypothetical protein